MTTAWIVLGSILAAFLIANTCMIINYISNILRWRGEINKIKFENLRLKLRVQHGRDWQNKYKL